MLMLKETVKAPKRFTKSTTTKKAKEVQTIPKNRSHKKSEVVITNKEELKSPFAIK